MAAVCAAGFGAVLGLVVARWPSLERTDRSIDDHLNRWISAHPAGVTAWKVVTTGLQPLTWEILTVVVAAVLIFRYHQRRLAFFALAAIFGTLGLYNLIKVTVDRARPRVPTPLLHPFGASFPSGHAMMSATAMILVVLACWSLLRRAVWRALVLVAAIAVAAAVAASRLVLGAHYLTDVLGAWLLAGAWVSLLVAAFGIRPGAPVSRRERSAAAPDPDRRPSGSAG